MSISENVHFKTAAASQFDIQIGTTSVDRVMTVGGLSVSVEVSSASTGTDLYERKRPGLIKFEDVTFKRGFFYDDRTMSDYWSNWMLSSGTPEDGSIILYNNGASGAAEEIARWNFFSAWPSKYTISDFDATSTDLVTEELTLTIERLERAD
ncbi:MAG: phage tail-like protein [Glaciecola sp.]|jgi:phage tail-like protein